MIDYAAARLNMVEGQLRTNRVTDEAVLAAFLTVPRERFVPAALRDVAYVDDDLALGGGRYLGEPRVLARLLQLVAIKPEETILIIGCGSGYAAALVARFARAVVATECDPRLAAEATRNLRDLGSSNVAVIEARLDEGYAPRAPYDVILFGGAVAAVPGSIVRQLAPEGRIAAVVSDGAGMGQAMLMTRVGASLSRRPVFDAGTPLLPGFEREAGFVF